MLATTDTNLEIPTLPGKDYHAAALGTWNGALVTLQTYVDGAWRTVPDGAWTEDFEVVRSNGPGTAARLVLSTAGDDTSLALTLTELPQ